MLKIFEHLAAKQIFYFFNKFAFLSSHQFGFRKSLNAFNNVLILLCDLQHILLAEHDVTCCRDLDLFPCNLDRFLITLVKSCELFDLSGATTC